MGSFVCKCCSTILEEEKLQQEERLRMEMRRQVTVSWDSGGSDEAPPKVRLYWSRYLPFIIHVCHGRTETNCYLSARSPVDRVTPALVPVKASSPAPKSTTSRYAVQTQQHTASTVRKLFSSVPSHPQWLQQCFLLAFRGFSRQQQQSAGVQKEEDVGIQDL